MFCATVRRALCVLLLLPSVSLGAELGYSLTHTKQRQDVSASVRGFEGRINFGGTEGRYSGDRWSLALGQVQTREVDHDHWIQTPMHDESFAFVDHLPAYSYINLIHRWYTRPARFEWAPQLRLFVGTGVGWRDAETCVKSAKALCWKGTAAVSNSWTFHQSFGFKWRERLEVAWEHDSTGGISALNFGDDIIRFSLFVVIGRD